MAAARFHVDFRLFAFADLSHSHLTLGFSYNLNPSLCFVSALSRIWRKKARVCSTTRHAMRCGDSRIYQQHNLRRPYLLLWQWITQSIIGEDFDESNFISPNMPLSNCSSISSNAALTASSQSITSRSKQIHFSTRPVTSGNALIYTALLLHRLHCV